MNAPHAWPTKYPLPQFRFKRVAIGGLGFLVVSCSENLTSPVTTKSPPSPAAAAVVADVIVMERTTTEAADAGQTPVVHTSRKVMNPLVRKSGPSVSVRAVESAEPAEPAALAGLPLPPVALPARRESAICTDLPTWTERSKGVNGGDVVVTGFGDAPASSIKVPQADGSTWNIERTWTRTATNWQLDKQVTTGARGYRDVVTYRHETPAGKVANNRIPSMGCVAQPRLSGMPSSAVSRSLYAPHAGALDAILFPGSGVTALSCDGGSGDDCYDKQLSIYRDDIAIVVAATAMTFACAPPAVILAAPCIGATTVYLAAVAALKFDTMSFQHCLEQQAKPTPVSLVTPGATTVRAASVVGAAPGTRASRAGFGGASRADCGSETADQNCTWYIIEISYDGGNTWQIFDAYVICNNAA